MTEVLLANDQCLDPGGDLREAAVAIARYQNGIGMAIASNAAGIDSRLDGHQRVLGQDVTTANSDPRRLMVAQPEAVPASMQPSPKISKALSVQERIDRGVDFCASYAGANHLESDLSGANHGRETLALLLRRAGSEERAFTLGRVPIDPRQHHRHMRPRAQAIIDARDRVGLGATWTVARDDMFRRIAGLDGDLEKASTFLRLNFCVLRGMALYDTLNISDPNEPVLDLWISMAKRHLAEQS
ncbi:hypothetical protein V9L20_20060 [Variovorax sp. CCNWLW225]